MTSVKVITTHLFASGPTLTPERRFQDFALAPQGNQREWKVVGRPFFFASYFKTKTTTKKV